MRSPLGPGFFFFLLAAVPAADTAAGGAALMFSRCGCLCVDGVPKTLCDSLPEAQANPVRCPPEQRCPLPGPPLADPGPLPEPPAGTRDCRAVRVWDAATGQYATVNVCDLADAPG